MKSKLFRISSAAVLSFLCWWVCDGFCWPVLKESVCYAFGALSTSVMYEMTLDVSWREL